MSAPWTAEHEVARDVLRASIARRWPHIDVSHFEHVGRGWDVDVWRAGDLAFRVPRRAMGVDALRNELRALPLLAPVLPAPVPLPELIAEPDDAIPVPFYAHRFLPGRSADGAHLDDAQRTALAAPLASLLRALHSLTLPLEPDTFRGALAPRLAKSLPRLDALAPSLAPYVLSASRSLLAHPPSPSTSATVVLHGDLYARHLLVDERAQLCAVIDWGDACLGDRAVDLAVAFTFLPSAARDTFFATYGDVDHATRERARFLGLCRHGIALLAYALDVGDEPLAAEARTALVNATR